MVGVRLETNTLSFSGTANASTTVSTPGLVNFSPVPTLSISTVNGVSVPSTASGLFTTSDITLPSSTSAGSVTVNLSASNVPVGTIVKVTVTPRSSSGEGGYSNSYNSTALSGTDASSTATATVALSSTSANVLRAETTFAVQTASLDFPVFAEGEKVEKVRVASNLGGKSAVYLITRSGKEILWE